MPQFLNEGNPGWGNALSSIGSSLANWGMNQMQIKQEREQKAQDLAREERLWKEHMDTSARMGVPEERFRQVKDEQTGKAMQIREQLKRGSAVEGTASEWQEVGREPIAPKKTFEPTLGGYFDEQGGFTPNAEAQDFLLKKQAAGASRTNVSLPGQGPQENAFQKQVGEKDADTFNTWRSNAVSAQQTLQDLNNLGSILEKQQTGKAQEALAMAGQFLGTEAGADLQTANAAGRQVIISTAQKLRGMGALTDRDMKGIEEVVPKYGNDPRANAKMLDMLKAGAQRQIDLFNAADQHVRKVGKLEGFTPAFNSTAAPPPKSDMGGAGSQKSPLEVKPGMPKPPSGTWVKLPSGKVVQVP